MMRGTTQPMPAVQQDQMTGQPADAHTHAQPSYYLTRWPFVNKILAIVEARTNGRAGVIQRFSTFLIIGGFAAVVNLIVFQLGLLVPLKIDDKLHNILAYLVAAEISIIANFIPNDAITFSHLPGHERPWLARCLRFHLTNIMGVTLTFLIEFTVHYRLGIIPLFSEAIAIIIVLFFNFTVHHLFTYRHISTPKESYTA